MNKGYKILKIILFVLYFIILTNNLYYSLISVLVICIHELGHLIILKSKKVSGFDFKFSFLGFKIDLKYNSLLNKDILTYLIGSLFNIVIGTFVLIINIFISSVILRDFVIISYVIGLINLIPAFPLDGAMALKSLLLKKYKYNLSMFVSVFLSVFISMCMFLFSIYIYINDGFVNFTFLIIPIFILISVYKEYKMFIRTYVIKNIDYKKYILLKRKYFKTKIITVHVNTRFFELIKLCGFSKFLIFYFLDDNLKFIGMMNEYNLLEIYKKYGNIKIMEYYEKIN